MRRNRCSSDIDKIGKTQHFFDIYRHLSTFIDAPAGGKPTLWDRRSGSEQVLFILRSPPPTATSTKFHVTQHFSIRFGTGSVYLTSVVGIFLILLLRVVGTRSVVRRFRRKRKHWNRDVFILLITGSSPRPTNSFNNVERFDGRALCEVALSCPLCHISIQLLHARKGSQLKPRS